MVWAISTGGVNLSGFITTMTRSKPQYSTIKVAVLELCSNEKEKAERPLKMNINKEETHAELVVALLRKFIPKAEIFLLPPTDEAADFIIKNKIPIVNMSLSSSQMNKQKEYELSKHAFLVTSAGNTGDKGETNAATKKWWCAVGAINRKKELQPYSSHGKGHIKTVAYSGEKINGIEFGGTSASSPVIVGLLAQWMCYFKNKMGDYPNAAEIYEYIIKNSEDLGEVGKDNEFGYGMLIHPIKFEDYEITRREIKNKTIMEVLYELFRNKA